MHVTGGQPLAVTRQADGAFSVTHSGCLFLAYPQHERVTPSHLFDTSNSRTSHRPVDVGEQPSKPLLLKFPICRHSFSPPPMASLVGSACGERSGVSALLLWSVPSETAPLKRSRQPHTVSVNKAASRRFLAHTVRRPSIVVRTDYLVQIQCSAYACRCLAEFRSGCLVATHHLHGDFTKLS